MAKSKYAPALFEVINRQKNTGKLGVPKWWKGGPQGPGGQDAAPGTVEAGEGEPLGSDPPSVTEESPATPVTSSYDPAEEPAAAVGRLRAADESDSVSAASDEWTEDLSGRWPAVRVESGRLYIALGPRHTAVLGGALLIALSAAFLLGRAAGGGTAPADGAMKELTQKPNPAVLDAPAGRTNAPPARAGARGPEAAGPGQLTEAAETPSEDELKPGSTYVLLCSYPENALASAEHTQKWLASTHNIRTVVRHWKQKEYWLVAVKPFKNRAEAMPFVQQMKDLSNDCLKEMKQAKLPLYGFADPMAFEARE